MLHGFIPDSRLVGAIGYLEYSLCSRDIDVVAVLGVGSDDESLRTLGAFHPELVDLGGVKVADPSFNRVEPNALRHYIRAAFASNMKGSFVPHLGSAHSLALHDFERLLFCELTFFGGDFLRVIVFGVVKIIGSGCCESTHQLIIII